MNITKIIEKKLHKEDKVTWHLSFKGGDEFYKMEPRLFVVNGKNAVLSNTDKIKGNEHLFKLFNINPFDGDVELNFLDEKINKNEKVWNYGDKVDKNKNIGDDIEYTVIKAGYIHKGSIKNYIISSKYKDLPIIGEEIIFTDDDLVEKNIAIIKLKNYDGGNMDKYIFRRNGEDITNNITIYNSTVSFMCKLNDTISVEFKRGNKLYDEHFNIEKKIYESGETKKEFDFESLNEDFEIMVNEEKIKNVTEIGYGYSGRNNVILRFEKPITKDGVKIVSNINDIDFDSGYYETDDMWKIIFTPNITSKDKNYKLTFTKKYYNTYIWSFAQKHAIEGTISWNPKDVSALSTDKQIQITPAEGTLTPKYEILNVTDEDGNPMTDEDGNLMTDTFTEILNQNTGELNTVLTSSSLVGDYVIDMRVIGESNNIYIKPSGFPPIDKSFKLSIVKPGLLPTS